MTNQTPSRKFSKADVKAAVAYADRSVTREAMRIPNAHDLNNIRILIHDAEDKINNKGAKGFHERMTNLKRLPNLSSLIPRGYAIIANRLGIELTEEEKKFVSQANSSVIWAKAVAPQQEADRYVDMLALKKEVTPRYNRPGEVSKSLRTTHSKEDFYHSLIKSGYPEDSAYRLADEYSITISRIGQTLARFNPRFNNCVDFLDIAVQRIIGYTIRKKPNTPEIFFNYVRAWRDEVKTDFMGVDMEKIYAIRRVMDAETEKLLMPYQKAQHPKVRMDPVTGEPVKDTSELRHFRNLAEGLDDQPVMSEQTYTQVAALFHSLSNNFSQRHDPQKVGIYLDAFMESKAYKEALGKMDFKTRRAVNQMMYQVYSRLDVPHPAELLDQENLNRTFRQSQRLTPNASGYLDHTARVENKRAAAKDRPPVKG